MEVENDPQVVIVSKVKMEGGISTYSGQAKYIINQDGARFYVQHGDGI
jgi:hypothetical protein